jgi:hypothetical protein
MDEEGREGKLAQWNKAVEAVKFFMRSESNDDTF